MMVRGSILIVDPNQLFREGLRYLLLKARFTVCGDGRSFAEVMKNAVLSKPADLIILALEPGNAMEYGLAQIKLIRRDYPSLKLVALAPSLSSAEFLQAMRAGADAVLTHDISGGVLRASLELVLQGQQVSLAPISHLLAEAAREPEAGQRDEKQGVDEISNLVPFAPLRPVGVAVNAPPAAVRLLPAPALSTERATTQLVSEREGQILGHLVRGLSNKAIARELVVAETTVKVHIKGLMRKVRAVNRTQVAIWATNHYFTAEEVAAQSSSSAIGLGQKVGVRSSAVMVSPDQPCSA